VQWPAPSLERTWALRYVFIGMSFCEHTLIFLQACSCVRRNYIPATSVVGDPLYRQMILLHISIKDQFIYHLYKKYPVYCVAVPHLYIKDISLEPRVCSVTLGLPVVLLIFVLILPEAKYLLTKGRY
jgi:hypothetical protein